MAVRVIGGASMALLEIGFFSRSITPMIKQSLLRNPGHLTVTYKVSRADSASTLMVLHSENHDHLQNDRRSILIQRVLQHALQVQNW